MASGVGCPLKNSCYGMTQKANGPETGPSLYCFCEAALVLISNPYVADTPRQVVRDRAHADDTTGVAYRWVLIKQVVKAYADR